MREWLYIGLSIWLSVIGGLMWCLGIFGEWVFRNIRQFGDAIIDYSFKFDI